MPDSHSTLGAARALIDADDEQLLATQVAICGIAAPTGAEFARGEFMAHAFQRLGLTDVHADAVGNVLGTRRGLADVTPVVLCSHLDTVFAESTPLGVTRQGNRFEGPGIVDNARGLAAMLSLATILQRTAHAHYRPILFAATVGEEGAGDLRGARHLFPGFDRAPAACVALDGAGDDRIVNTALGARRLRIDFSGPGGHSWSGFGMANPIHAAGLVVARIHGVKLPASPKSTLSVCRIGGGTSINSIPEDAWIEVDLRSSVTTVIRRLEAEVRAIAHACVADINATRMRGSDELTTRVTVIGDRPSGRTEPEHPLVRHAIAATESIGREANLVTSSTDANVPMSLGIPAIAIGAGGRGGGTHTTGEWYENTEGPAGVYRALTILAGAAELRDAPG